MVVIYVSTTHPVNPPEKASDILTHDELWAALVAKARHPEEFVAAIETSRIVREDATGLTRAVLFKGELGKGGEVEEEIKYFGKMKIDFAVPKTGQFVQNIISVSSTGAPEELFLTFTFHWPHPDVAEGSEEAKKLEEKYWAMSRQVVPHTIETARKMKAEGRLGL
ncbi:hypothetical protein DTO271D3_2375 [Paecilomyces variotii]|nr:hypothetical protein DTO169C6_8346 [Paecilomyces variotii]KAJ9269997.1 hypothetical protein DTO212C5_3967 [Paecilomyces variotii]KAJ9283650.1 hypothetical protein DTO021C3_8766 [Paecilomyces variotii]KAJ9317554.1 hypothetical protein DTO271D3_2375 [Paecilomyces variotii]KAJ9404346.1 hypothetical protein DTO045G8_7955 [Paecilomyces variotii]